MEKMPLINWKHHDPGVMTCKTAGDVVFFSNTVFDRLGWLYHGFATRQGGVSTGIYRSMNLSFRNSDSDEHVLENYRRIGQAVGFEPDRAVSFSQIHSSIVHEVAGRDAGTGVVRPAEYEADGMVTNEAGITLTVLHADCVPILFADPVRRCIGAVHSGWRGTTAKIGMQAVRKMQDLYGSRPEDILAAVGPSICRDCYEVSGDVIEKADLAFKDWNPLRALYIKGEKEGKYQLDLWEMNRQVLKQAGLKEQNIFLPQVCTCCNPELLFSHRATGGKRGTLASFIGIREMI